MALERTRCPNCNAPLTFQNDRHVYICEYCKGDIRDKSNHPVTNNAPEKKIIYPHACNC